MLIPEFVGVLHEQSNRTGINLLVVGSPQKQTRPGRPTGATDLNTGAGQF